MSENSDISRIVGAYESGVIRLYARIRFHILRQVFLAEIGQYLPEKGRVLDLGCGFGLFSMYFALRRPEAQFSGIDLSKNRILEAQAVAERLGIRNVSYRQGNAREYDFGGPFDAVYMLDLVHHVPPETVKPLLEKIHGILPVGGRLLIKDVNDRPFYKVWFTWVLDKFMDFRAPVRYWGEEELRGMLETLGFQVYIHHMTDHLPYPHILYVCTRK